MQLLPSIELNERRAMLTLARTAITAHWMPDTETAAILPYGELKSGCFVTLHKHGELRGCIGTLEQDMPLQQSIPYFARAAAFQDPRFPPLTTAELADRILGISVPSEREPLPHSSRLELMPSLAPVTDQLRQSDGFPRAHLSPPV